MPRPLTTPLGLLASLILLAHLPARADDDAAPVVRLKYTSGDTELDFLKPGVKCFTGRDHVIEKFPDELTGLTFTRRVPGKPASVELDAAANSTVFLLVDTESNPDGGPELNRRLADAGWTRLATDATRRAGQDDRKPGGAYKLAVYQRTFDERQSLSLTGATWSGYIVAAKRLEVATPGTSAAAKLKKSAAPRETPLFSDNATKPSTDKPTTRPARVQTSVNTLGVYEQKTGLMVGHATETTLTLTRGSSPKPVTVRWVTPVGNGTRLAQDEAERFIHLTYPNWNVDKAEMTFETKYVKHDGGSIGAAVGTLILSAIEGVELDPAAAMTGDISANGKVRMIGGVYAKLRGAIAAKCTLVALPTANEEQLVDAHVYGGPSLLTDVQIIGIDELRDAVAVMRVDRAPRLAEALAAFAALQQESQGKPPSFWSAKTTAEKLRQVLELCPRHLSAKVLLAAAEGKLPKTLSAYATTYYVAVAVSEASGLLKERASSKQAQVPSATVKVSLTALRKLKPIANPKVLPLVDAWERFIEAWSAYQEGGGSLQYAERQRQAVLDEMAKEQTDLDLLQKMKGEGI